ncbi:AT-rich interactive domain-containing protein 1A [Drosophila serrata]|uniref:AT-rich interactive domain-containing protein 1A n=1 Tax=Drosophila serrata TaxID=7274 RepID=UPI000A1D352C|nr:AT-rich interactive domain-containing protein 1A [Drosophila serrata]
MPSPHWLLLSMLALVGAQEYHYHRPQTPFGPESNKHQPQQTTKFTVHTLGRTYGLEAQRAPTVYEDHQTQYVQLLQQRQVAQPQALYQAPPQQQAYPYPAAVPQQQQQQLHTSSYQNPLLVSANYQAPTYSQAPPAPAHPLSYYQPQQTQTPSYYGPPQVAAQPPAQYGPPQSPPQKLFFGNPYPYAPVTTGSGQQVLDAGHGSGVAPNPVQVQLIAATGSAPPALRVGDQVGQAQSAQIDGYDYKQTSPGDTRDYQRFVTNCPGGGNCERRELSPGQVDEGHKQVVQLARASTQPRVEGCFKSPVIYVPAGAAVNAQNQLRPKNRRLTERQEQIITRYPHN